MADAETSTGAADGSVADAVTSTTVTATYAITGMSAAKAEAQLNFVENVVKARLSRGIKFHSLAPSRVNAPKRRPPSRPDRLARDRRRRNFKIGSRFHGARAPRERDERRRRRAIDVPSASREVGGDVCATRDRARHDPDSRARECGEKFADRELQRRAAPPRRFERDAAGRADATVGARRSRDGIE